MSKLYVNELAPRDGASVAIPGHVIQVVHAQSTTEVVVNTTTYQDSNLTATITPSSATSKILVLMSPSFFTETTDASNTIEMHTRITRNGTAIKEFKRVIVIRATAYSGILGNGHQGSISYIDSPASTTPVTYTLQLASSTATQGARINKDSIATSTITLMEIAQ